MRLPTTTPRCGRWQEVCAMAEQAVDLRSWMATVRRHGRLLAAAVAVGAAAGATLAITVPPMYSSTSQVLLPPAQPGADGLVVARNPETTVRIAESDAVLEPAGKTLDNEMSVRDVKKAVNVTAAS